METKDFVTYKDGRIWADLSDVRRMVRKTGLRSKKTRKILKRWKRLINDALMTYVEENRE